MFRVIRLFTLFLLIGHLSSCAGQQVKSSDEDKNSKTGKNVVGGPFENAEFMYIDMPEQINSIDTSPGWSQPGEKLMITGTIFELDGRTPAPDVLLYYYHTDVNGLYASSQDLHPEVRRHGNIRGWIKTDQEGRYAIYTTRPGAYPSRTEPAHIHLSIKEPAISKEYYIHSLVFDDDPSVNTAYRKNLDNRGGSGILRLLKDDEGYIAEHNIILGLNIPNYPIANQRDNLSGLAIGENIISFTPYHVWGPDQGKKVCPICKYGRHQGILYFVGKDENWSDVKEWMSFFEKESISRGIYLKVYFVFDQSAYPGRKYLTKQLEDLGSSLEIKETAITIVPSFVDSASKINENKIDPGQTNTIILFRQSTIVDKFLSLTPNQDQFNLIHQRLNETQSEYVDLIPIHLEDNQK